MNRQKINHLLRSGSLAAALLVLASCSQDLQPVSVPGGESARPTVGEVRLELSAPLDGADTRLDYDADGYHFEAGDTLAACQMDRVNTSALNDPAAGWYDKYTLTGSINTNYPFVRDAQGEWTSPAKLSEGNYFFMFPYSSQRGSRQSYIHTLHAQTLKDGSMASLMRLYAEGNFFVGYARIEEGTSNSEAVRVDMRPAFGALGLVLRNDGQRACTVRRIAVSHPDGGFLASVTVDPTACTYATEDGTFNIAQYTGDDSEDGRAHGYEDNREGYTRRAALDDLIKPLPGQKAVEKIEVRIEEGATVAAGKEQRLLVMLPKGTYRDLLLEVETDRGTVRNLLIEGETLVSPDLKTSRTASFDDSDLSVLPETSVSGTDDLARLIRWNVDTPTTLTANLRTDVSMTRAMYEQLRDGKSELLRVNLNGHCLVLEKDVDETALCGKLECLEGSEAGGSVIVTGHQVLDKSVGATIRNENELLLTGGSGYRIENRGSLTVDGEATGVTVSNAGVLYTEPEASVSGVITVESNGVVVNRGTLEGLENDGRVTNYGYMQGSGNAGIIRNLAGEVRMDENTGYIYAEEYSATVLKDNEGSSGKGTLVITDLAEEGNFKVENAQGYIVQELEGEQTTKQVSPLANTIWLNGTLSGAKNANGNAQDIDLTRYAIVAVGAESRLANEGRELKTGSLLIKAGASLTIYRTDVECPSVEMQGEAGAPAVLTISTLSNLYAASNQKTRIIGNGTGYNTLKNYGGEKTRIEASGL